MGVDENAIEALHIRTVMEVQLSQDTPSKSASRSIAESLCLAHCWVSLAFAAPFEIQPAPTLGIPKTEKLVLTTTPIPPPNTSASVLMQLSHATAELKSSGKTIVREFFQETIALQAHFEWAVWPLTLGSRTLQ